MLKLLFINPPWCSGPLWSQSYWLYSSQIMSNPIRCLTRARGRIQYVNNYLLPLRSIIIDPSVNAYIHSHFVNYCECFRNVNANRITWEQWAVDNGATPMLRKRIERDGDKGKVLNTVKRALVHVCARVMHPKAVRFTCLLLQLGTDAVPP